MSKLMKNGVAVMNLLLLILASTVCLNSCDGDKGVGGGPATYSVTYDGNGNTGGTVPTDATRYQQGQMVTVLANTGNLAKAGSFFAGWNTQADGNGITHSAPQTFAMGSANVVLYAKWTTNPTYTVTYNGNGNTGGSVPTDSTRYEQGQTVTVFTNTGSLEKTGGSFGGWNLASDGTGTHYAATGTDTFVMDSADVVLYAEWVSSSVGINYCPDLAPQQIGGYSPDIVIAEFQPQEFIRFFNNTNSTITLDNADNHYIASSNTPTDQPLVKLSGIASYVTNSGAAVLIAPKSYATLSWPVEFTTADMNLGELALYTGGSGTVTDASAIKGYVCWGTPDNSPAHGIALTAIQASIGPLWIGPCASTMGEGQSMHRIGYNMGMTETSYYVSAPTGSQYLYCAVDGNSLDLTIDCSGTGCDKSGNIIIQVKDSGGSVVKTDATLTGRTLTNGVSIAHTVTDVPENAQTVLTFLDVNTDGSLNAGDVISSGPNPDLDYGAITSSSATVTLDSLQP